MTAIVREMVQEDMRGVEALYKRVFGERALSYWRRRFEWQYVSNPATGLRPSRMWVGVKNRRIVGFLSSFPVQLKTPGGVAAVLCPGDLMVAADVRGEGLGERVVRAYTNEAGLLPHGLAYSVGGGETFKRAGYRRVPAQQAFVRPEQGGPVFREYARRHLPWWAQWLRPVIAPVAHGSAALVNILHSPRQSTRLEIDLDPSIESDFDDLWSVAAGEIPFVFARDAPTLTWRYKDDPLIRHTLIAARDLDGTLMGYTALCLVQRGEIRIGKIMDLFCAPSRAPRVVNALLPAVLHHFRVVGADLISSKGLHPAIRREVRRCLYLKLPNYSSPALMLWNGDRNLMDTVFAADNWHLSHADGDEDFVP